MWHTLVQFLNGSSYPGRVTGKWVQEKVQNRRSHPDEGWDDNNRLGQSLCGDTFGRVLDGGAERFLCRSSASRLPPSRTRGCALRYQLGRVTAMIHGGGDGGTQLWVVAVGRLGMEGSPGKHAR